ncbi:MAG TPA: polysaccharide deacetylase family protein, partial [Marmoricola sp.]|nr:polysaccharide deacetylase family protein [Marmoricola sp.]
MGHVTTTTYTSRGRKLTRRTVLLGIASAVVGAADLGVSTDPSSEPPMASRTGDRSTRTAAARSITAPVTLTTSVPSWAKRWNAPVYELGDFIRRSPHAHFPRRSVMLTIDDGPHPVWTPRYLQLLEKYNVKATFNMIGAQVPSQRTLVRAMASEGHTLANHTWTHDERLPYRTIADIRTEIARTNDAIEKAAHVRPQIFRAPGGVWGPRVFDVLAQEGMLPLGWDIDPRD